MVVLTAKVVILMLSLSLQVERPLRTLSLGLLRQKEFTAAGHAQFRMSGGRTSVRYDLQDWNNVLSVSLIKAPKDALTLKQTSGTSYIIGGGARHASDKGKGLSIL